MRLGKPLLLAADGWTAAVNVIHIPIIDTCAPVSGANSSQINDWRPLAVVSLCRIASR